MVNAYADLVNSSLSSSPASLSRTYRLSFHNGTRSSRHGRGGLILLGASFARLKISRERFKQMPIAAICVSRASSWSPKGHADMLLQAVTFVKLLVMPIIGVSIVIGFRNNTGLFPGNQRSK